MFVTIQNDKEGYKGEEDNVVRKKFSASTSYIRNWSSILSYFY